MSSDNGKPSTALDKLAVVLKGQSPQTILLLAIVALVFYGLSTAIPWHIRLQNESHERQTGTVVEAFKAVHEADKQTRSELMNMNTRLLDQHGLNKIFSQSK